MLPKTNEGRTAQSGASDVIAGDVYCQECGYNLRGLTGDRCPECGYSLDAIRSSVSQIPWIQREELGLLRAYWRTVCFVMFRHKRFCEQIVRPVDYGEAQRFRRLTILHAYVPVVVVTLAAIFKTPASPGGDDFVDIIHSSVWYTPGVLACFLLTLFAITGVPSYFFHPRDLPLQQQNSAVAMSYYASASLAWTALPAVMAFAAMAFERTYEWTSSGLWMAAILVPFGQLAAWWLDLIHISARLIPHRRRRTVTMAIAVPVLWLIVGGTIFIGLPLAVLYVVLFFVSLG